MKKDFAVVGRTIGTYFFDSLEEARDFVSSFPSWMIDYDQEVAIYKRDASGAYGVAERYYELF